MIQVRGTDTTER